MKVISILSMSMSVSIRLGLGEDNKYMSDLAGRSTLCPFSSLLVLQKISSGSRADVYLLKKKLS